MLTRRGVVGVPRSSLTTDSCGGCSDAIDFAPGFGPRPHTPFTGVFGASTKTKYRDVLDGLSHTFGLGEAADGWPLCEGIDCDVPNTARSDLPLADQNTVHSWLIAAACPSNFYAGGMRYAGDYGSTVEPINKTPATDSFYDLTQLFNPTPSWQGGTHRMTNFRSYHEGGTTLLFLMEALNF